MTQYHPNGMQESGSARAGTSLSDRARDHFEHRIGEAREATVAAHDRARDTVARGRKETARFVRENPGASLAGALGIGVLIGLVFGRGRR